MVNYKSKRAVVSKAPYELYMAFVDMRNFVNFLPADKKEGVTADYDSIHAEVQGFNIGVKVVDRTPYSKIEYADDGAPFHFSLKVHFDVRGLDISGLMRYLNESIVIRESCKFHILILECLTCLVEVI